MTEQTPSDPLPPCPRQVHLSVCSCLETQSTEPGKLMLEEFWAENKSQSLLCYNISSCLEAGRLSFQHCRKIQVSLWRQFMPLFIQSVKHRATYFPWFQDTKNTLHFRLSHLFQFSCLHMTNRDNISDNYIHTNKQARNPAVFMNILLSLIKSCLKNSWTNTDTFQHGISLRQLSLCTSVFQFKYF